MHITFSRFNSKIFVELTIRLSDAKVTLLEVEEYFVRYMVYDTNILIKYSKIRPTEKAFYVIAPFIKKKDLS